MNKIFKFFLLLVGIPFLSSCGEDNWFNHPISYSGNDLSPQLVMTGDLRAFSHPEIFLNTAYFLGDPARINPSNNSFNKGWILDADVAIRVDGGDWQPLHVVKEARKALPMGEVLGNHKAYDVYYYTCDLVLQPGQEVEVRAQYAPLQADATAKQRIPSYIEATVSDMESLRYVSYDELISLSLLQGNLHISAPIPASSDDKLFLRMRSYGINYRVRDNGEIAENSMTYTPTYAQNQCFSKYVPQNESLSLGWYGSAVVGLFADAPQQSTSFPILTRVHEYVYKLFTEEDYYVEWTDSVVVDARLVSEDFLRFYTSLLDANLISYKHVGDLWANTGINEVTRIINDVEDLFDKLGTAEHAPVYSNVTGALGCVVASAGTTIVLHKPLLDGNFTPK